MLCDLLVFILRASCEQTVNITRLCDKKVVAQAKVLKEEVENPQILAFCLAQWNSLYSLKVIWLMKPPTHLWWSPEINNQRMEQMTSRTNHGKPSAMAYSCFTLQRPLRLFRRMVTCTGEEIGHEWRQCVMGREMVGEMYSSQGRLSKSRSWNKRIEMDVIWAGVSSASIHSFD